MSGRRARRAVAPIAPPLAADPADRRPSVPSTTPLAADQISAAPAPAPVAAPIAATVPVTETAPLPSPSVAPGAPVTDPAAAPLIHVDSKVPLPSDQLTPVVPAAPVEPAPLAVGQVAPPQPEAAATPRREEAGTSQDGFRLGDAVDAIGDPLFPAEAPMLSAAALELLRGDLAEIGFDNQVRLSPDTVTMLCIELGIEEPMATLTRPAPLLAGDRGIGSAIRERAEADAARAAAWVERRFFPVVSDVEHDGRLVSPGGEVLVTFAEFERLRAGMSIAPSTGWMEGELG